MDNFVVTGYKTSPKHNINLGEYQRIARALFVSLRLRSNHRHSHCALTAAGAAKVLGHDHGVTQALAKASITMAKADLWHARLGLKTLRRDQREAIAAAAEG